MADIVPEFSRIISTARISSAGIEETIQAKPAERTALIKRFDLLDLLSLKAVLTIQHEAQHSFTVTGSITADIVQRCVVTLEPLASHMDVDINVTFIPADQNKEGAGSPYPEELDDEFELYSNGKIDLGEMVAQQMGINIDPYPRKPNAALSVTEFGIKSEPRQPFAQLAEAVKNKKNKDVTKD